MAQLLVYGTLAHPEIAGGLLEREVEYQPDLVRGFKRVGLNYADYPGAIFSRWSSLTCSRMGVSESELELLDAFEGSEFARIQLSDSRHIYILRKQDDVKPAWSPELFEAHHLQEYIDDIVPEFLEQWKQQL